MVVVDGNEVKGIITRKDLLPDALLRRLRRLHHNMEYVHSHHCPSTARKRNNGSSSKSYHHSMTRKSNRLGM